MKRFSLKILNLIGDINKTAVYTNNATSEKLSGENKKIAFMVFVETDLKKVRLSAEPGNRIFVSKLRHKKSKKSILNI